MLESFLINQTAVFLLVLGRVGGVIATAPILSSAGTPRRVKAFLAVALSLLVAPMHTGSIAVTGVGTLSFARMLGLEVIVGLLLGLGVMILLSGVQLAGQIVSQASGMALGNVFNPEVDENVSVFSQLFYFVTLALFVVIGGHRMVIQALMETFEWAPPGHVSLGESYTDAVLTLAGQSFELGVRAAAPLMIALFLSTIVLGLISRTLPQINTIVIGFGLNSMLTLALLMLTVGVVAWTFQTPIAGALDTLVDAVEASAVSPSG